MTLPRDLTTANEAHITALIDAQASEGTHLDFKRDLPGRDGRGTNDLAADVSAFANSSGGDLVTASMRMEKAKPPSTSRWRKEVSFLKYRWQPRAQGIGRLPGPQN